MNNTPQGENGATPEESLELRALTRSVGMVFQTAGLVLALGGCCLWSISGCFQSELTQQPDSLAAWIRIARPVDVCVGLGIIVSFAAGMAFLTIGMGMTAEKRYSGRAAMIAAGLFAALWLADMLLMAIWARNIFGTLAALLISVIGFGLFLLAGASARELQKHPPPADLNVVPADFDPRAAARKDPPVDDSE